MFAVVGFAKTTLRMWVLFGLIDIEIILFPFQINLFGWCWLDMLYDVWAIFYVNLGNLKQRISIQFISI